MTSARWKRWSVAATVARDEGSILDWIVIDGGAGQVTAALKAFLSQGPEPPELIDLPSARRSSTVTAVNRQPPITIPHCAYFSISATKLTILPTVSMPSRSKRLKESILDDFKGLGTKRKQQLLQHLSLENCAAESRSTHAVEGIGTVTAERPWSF